MSFLKEVIAYWHDLLFESPAWLDIDIGADGGLDIHKRD